jgi:threonine aldolase
MLESGAFLRHAAHANAMARKLAALSPFPVRHPPDANAVFLDMDDAALARLQAAGWIVHRFLDGSVRFMCSWSTTEESVEALAEALSVVG